MVKLLDQVGLIKNKTLVSGISQKVKLDQGFAVFSVAKVACAYFIIQAASSKSRSLAEANALCLASSPILSPSA
jgi:hypothetical protein